MKLLKKQEKASKEGLLLSGGNVFLTSLPPDICKCRLIILGTGFQARKLSRLLDFLCPSKHLKCDSKQPVSPFLDSSGKSNSLYV